MFCVFLFTHHRNTMNTASKADFVGVGDHEKPVKGAKAEPALLHLAQFA